MISLSNAAGASASWGCAIPITRAMTIAQEIRAGTASPYIESGHRGVLNFGDTFSYALAKSLDAPLLFVGRDFATTDIKSALD